MTIKRVCIHKQYDWATCELRCLSSPAHAAHLQIAPANSRGVALVGISPVNDQAYVALRPVGIIIWHPFRVGMQTDLPLVYIMKS